MRYRKKPVVIEAFQMTSDVLKNPTDQWPVWLLSAWQTPPEKEGALFPVDNPERPLGIRTLEGYQEVTLDDFIIQGVQGEIYPCKPDIFWETYEKAE